MTFLAQKLNKTERMPMITLAANIFFKFITSYIHAFAVTVHGLSMPAHCNRILPMLRIPNRQNLRPQLYHTEFSVQKIPTREK